ncbi:MAG: hypothetical protein K9G33_07725 [Sneathiella sp.]|nr:hypothetical protein [Sneathiella sp.]
MVRKHTKSNDRIEADSRVALSLEPISYDEVGSGNVTYEFFIKSAERGQPKDQFELARIYATGVLAPAIPLDHRKAVKWLRMAIKGDHAEAHCLLGIMYLHGHGGLKKNEDRAISLFEKAAELGSGLGAYCAYHCLQKGHIGFGVAQKAERYLDLAVERNVPKALLFKGLAVGIAAHPDHRDIPNAIQYLERAAALGENRALLSLYRLHFVGFAPETSEEKKLKYLFSAADKGVKEAWSSAADKYFEIGNYKKAKEYYEKIIENGDPIYSESAKSQIEFINSYENNGKSLSNNVTVESKHNNGAEIPPENLSESKSENLGEALSAIFDRADEITASDPRGRPAKGTTYQPKTPVQTRLDADVDSWLNDKSAEPRRYMNSLLRALMEAEKGQIPAAEPSEN